MALSSRGRWATLLIGACFAVGFSVAWAQASPDWHLNASIIEACSCPMFCTCYFNPNPAAHHAAEGAEHFCRFNMGFQVNDGHYGDVDLTGARFWLAGDLGENFGDGRTDWATLHFDPDVTEKQREGILASLPKAYPVEWDSFTVGADGEIAWKHDDAMAHASLGGGEMAEVKLHHMNGNHEGPVVISNLPYWAVPRHDGFVLMPNEVEAYRVGDHAFEYSGGNGFMITFDIKSSDLESAAGTEAP